MFLLWISLLAWSGPPLERPADEQTEPATPTGQIVFDMKLPASLFLNGQQIVQLYQTGKVEVRAVAGTHELTVVTSGNPKSSELYVLADHTTPVLIGRHGQVTPQPPIAAPTPDPDGASALEIHVVGDEPVSIWFGDERWLIASGTTHHTEVPQGEHALSVRNADSTVVWARGGLLVHGSSGVVMQVGAGLAPEVSGAGQWMGSVTP